MRVVTNLGGIVIDMSKSQLILNGWQKRQGLVVNSSTSNVNGVVVNKTKQEVNQEKINCKDVVKEEFKRKSN